MIPSVPGFGFSTPVRQTGWELGRTTAAFAELMARLGYSRYGAHGGDIGAGISGRLGATDAAHVVGTLVVTDPGSLGLAGEQFPIPDHLTEEERARVEQERTTWRAERGYLDLQGHRPETIAAALTDSPVGQLAWIVEKFQTWTNPASKTPDEAVDRDQLLTNVSLYWFTRSGASAARFLSEAEHSDLDWIAPLAYQAAGWCSTLSPSCGGSWTRSTRWPTGANTPRAGTFLPWKSLRCWSMIFDPSSVICADLSAAEVAVPVAPFDAQGASPTIRRGWARSGRGAAGSLLCACRVCAAPCLFDQDRVCAAAPMIGEPGRQRRNA